MPTGELFGTLRVRITPSMLQQIDSPNQEYTRARVYIYELAPMLWAVAIYSWDRALFGMPCGVGARF